MSQEDSQQLQDSNLSNLIREEEFVFRFKQLGRDHVLRVNVPIPLSTTVKEFAYRIIGCHSIAGYVEDGNIESFISVRWFMI